MAASKKKTTKRQVKLEDIKELSKKDMETVAGGKSVMPNSGLAGYKLLKVYDPKFKP